jgi:hypothetical protein
VYVADVTSQVAAIATFAVTLFPHLSGTILFGFAARPALDHRA